MIPVITIYNSAIPKLLLEKQHMFFERVILVYNSEIDTKELQLPINCYVLKNGNKNFVAGALNKGIMFGIEQGHDNFLLLDDDSSFIREEDIRELHNDKGHNGIFQLRNSSDNIKSSITITNGTVITKGVFEKVGIFNEKMGIDLVDVDYFFRARKAGLDFMRTSKIYFNHNLGYYSGKYIETPNYSPMRYYNQSKNLLLLVSRHWRFFPRQMCHIILRKLYYFFKILVFESDRRTNVKMIFRGIRDGI
jgi:rhamnosyltransferase